MAAIDKMYLNWYEFTDLRVWALQHYRKLFNYMIYPFISQQEFFDWTKEIREQRKEIIIREYEEFGYCNTEEEKECYAEVTSEDYLDLFYDDKLPMTNTPCKVDKYLLWHCPLPCVRKYLEDNCGYKTRWYHKIFWKGRND